MSCSLALGTMKANSKKKKKKKHAIIFKVPTAVFDDPQLKSKL
jgi:hypothetical protein